VAAARAAGADRVTIAPYLLTPGHFADRLAAAGADLVAEPLGAHPAVVDLVLDRAASTQG
jgi:sirohydrochlorin ferrochelatase